MPREPHRVACVDRSEGRPNATQPSKETTIMRRLASALCGGLISLASALFSLHSHAAVFQMAYTSADIATGASDTVAAGPAPMPRKPSQLPLSPEEWRYDLAPSERLRPDLIPHSTPREWRDHIMSSVSAAADCPSIDALGRYHGATLAARIAELSDPTCTYALFPLAHAQAGHIFSAENIGAVSTRFVAEAAAYRPGNRALLSLALFLRAAYFAEGEGRLAAISPEVRATLRPALMALLNGSMLFTPNRAAPATAGEVVTLIVNMNDEAPYLDVMKQWVERFTNRAAAPNVAKALRDPTIGYGFTAILKVFYFSHYRADALARVESDPSFAMTLYAFVKANKQSLAGDKQAGYQLQQAANEAFRFAMHPALRPTVGTLLQDALANSSMAGADRLVWLAAAQAIKTYDNANCSAYRTCDFEKALADALLSKRYACANGAIVLRTASLNPGQAGQACSTLARLAPRFHTMLDTRRVPVADDYNARLEVVVFSDRTEYQTYSSALFGNDTNNGGMYLEGDPRRPDNLPRFIAFVATWLQPHFEIWNLEHEFVHYLDGRYDMYGDFDESSRMPAVWYIEGLAEYLSRGNDNPESIAAARTGRYRLSDILRNTYAMDDYVNRAYRWGYMAVRFMFERHPEVMATILPMFRSGDYVDYWAYVKRLPKQFDAEFADWAQTAQTSGSPVPPWRGN
ncbi:collagenase [Trinickia caryophylli]|nr:collagenase [Trinickia caryophylli]TRX14208.1 collagenase [Trinickia caryophylli]